MWTQACGSPPRTCLLSLRTLHPAGSAARRKRPSLLEVVAATGPSTRVPEECRCLLPVRGPRRPPAHPSLSSLKGLPATRPQRLLCPLHLVPPHSQGHPLSSLVMLPIASGPAETSRRPQHWQGLETTTQRNSTSERPLLWFFRHTSSGPTAPLGSKHHPCSQPSFPGVSGT